MNARKPRHPEKVYLNVYDLNKKVNDVGYQFGFGVFHSGLEIYGTEYTFSDSGIYTNPPKNAGEGATFREQILMGEVEMFSKDVEDSVNDLRSTFAPGSYDPLKKNCNSFSNALCKRLLAKNIPSWVNRLAYWGSAISCILPDRFQDQRTNRSSHRVNSKSYKSFSGKGRSLGGAQSSTIKLVETRESTSDASSKKKQAERRRRLLEAAMKRSSLNS